MHSISPTITSPITSPTTTPATIPTITLTIFGTGIFPKICKTRDILNRFTTAVSQNEIQPLFANLYA
ncbi:hypothetical protein BASA50_004200 [Batrachochytrium salamandrivorans]|uniref:Uncharacterized protein n=1 Tax=Batrachochytrium salamandrivorans TaxID=1357716 RepID=A0ABQ8FHK7_9FUNG|nr:hypothetical protein BASA50_004200 [Batrachochytrium salamandrivorans]KAH9269374.1 hypothetical protein BASA83_008601 [Batrachochytrium salamandrivorans]